ncbi:MAG: hypothetical protein IJS39_15995 [Synergistaceae bacterium]|nr:hypothetical protein [Synergistaceae bacterium]
MKSFAVAKKHDCVSAFFVSECFAADKFAVKELMIPAIITVMIREAVCE